jgi:uncharacterized protein YaiE (UPF0345 family)
MSAQVYAVHNGPMQTTAPPAKVTTGTTTKTMLQLLNASTAWRVIEWGISFDGTAVAAPIQCELITTLAVAATVTAFVAADITQFSDPLSNAPPGLTMSTAGSGYSASAEGAVAAVRTGDLQQVAPTNAYVKQFPLGREFEIPAATVLRVRVTAAAAVNCYTYVVFEV